MAHQKIQMPSQEQLLSFMDRPGVFYAADVGRGIDVREFDALVGIMKLVKEKLARVVEGRQPGTRDFLYELTPKGRKLARQ